MLKNKDILKCEQFLKRGDDVNMKDKNGNTVIFHGIDYNNIELIKILSTYKAGFNIQNENGDVPLMHDMIFY